MGLAQPTVSDPGEACGTRRAQRGESKTTGHAFVPLHLLGHPQTLLHLLLKVSDLVVRLENMLLIPSPDESTSQIEHSPIGVRDMNGMITSDTFHPSGEEDPDEQR